MKRIALVLLVLISVSNVFALDIRKMEKSKTTSQNVLELLADEPVVEEDPYSWLVIPTIDTTPPKLELPNNEYYEAKEKMFTGFFTSLYEKVKKILEW